ncbi:MAG: VWA domain-containing protein [Myxococcales bacterium]|nr:VWA domain-containing protein [Myxococcales bacterium]
MTRRCAAALLIASALAGCGRDPGPDPCASECFPHDPPQETEYAASSSSSAGSSSSDATSSSVELPCMEDGDCPAQTPSCCAASDGGSCDEGYCWFDPGDCGQPSPRDAQVTAHDVVLVLDKSGSMFASESHWDHDGDDLDGDGFQDDAPMQPATPPRSRWSSLHAAVSTLAQTHGDALDLGAQLFPSAAAVATPPAQACAVESPPELPVAPMNGDALVAALPAADVDAAGESPATRGVLSAIDHLNSLEPAAGRRHELVLVTDGRPNCSAGARDDAGLLLPDAQLSSTLAAARAQSPGSITTHVVGLDIDGPDDGVDVTALLNEAAIAGGAPRDNALRRYHDAWSEAALLSALDVVARGILCTVRFEYEEGELVEGLFAPVVTMNGEADVDLLDDTTACEQGDGWLLRSEDPYVIQLCGARCDEFLAGASVSLGFVCAFE